MLERPVKKPRLQGPDGFQKSKPTTPYKPPESITKFVSAFDGARSSSSPAPPKSPTKKKHVSLVTAGNERPRNPFVDFDVPRRSDAGPSKPSSSSVRSLRESTPLKVFPSPVATSLQTTNAEPSGKTTRALGSRQPVLKLPPPSPERPRSILKPLPAPIPPLIKPSIPPPPSEKPRSILKPPMVSVPSSTKPCVPLRPLAPPPLPAVLTSPKKPMKTILTTNIAQAIDPTREGAGPELLSLFLQQHGHNFTSSTDRELQRGVMMSPDKRSRKFIRGGLAERFDHRIACTKTDFVLWRRQMEQKIESGSRLASDMQLRVLRVLDVSKPPSRPSRATTGPRTGLALCRLLRRHHLANGDLTLGTYVVVFHFAPETGGSRSAVSSADRFEQGSDLMVWMPWHKVELAGLGGSEGLLEMFRTLDTLTPPHSLLVVSRFCLRRVDATN